MEISHCWMHTNACALPNGMGSPVECSPVSVWVNIIRISHRNRCWHHSSSQRWHQECDLAKPCMSICFKCCWSLCAAIRMFKRTCSILSLPCNSLYLVRGAGGGQYAGWDLRATASRRSALALLLSDAEIVLCLGPWACIKRRGRVQLKYTAKSACKNKVKEQGMWIYAALFAENAWQDFEEERIRLPNLTGKSKSESWLRMHLPCNYCTHLYCRFSLHCCCTLV